MAVHYHEARFPPNDRLTSDGQIPLCFTFPTKVKHNFICHPQAADKAPLSAARWRKRLSGHLEPVLLHVIRPVHALGGLV